MKISPEEVGYWYFRLNGFLTIPNFVLHPDEGGNQKTDIDILGVRFPHRAELLHDSMKDADVFTSIADKPFVAFVEIKRGRCEINRTLLNPKEMNIQRSLRAVGVFPVEHVDEIANEIYKSGYFVTESYFTTICCLGDSPNEHIAEHYPEVRQILWDDVLSFVYQRFQTYRSRKYDHPQWDNVGKILWNASAETKDIGEFIYVIRKLWSISESS